MHRPMHKVLPLFSKGLLTYSTGGLEGEPHPWKSDPLPPCSRHIRGRGSHRGPDLQAPHLWEPSSVPDPIPSYN